MEDGFHPEWSKDLDFPITALSPAVQDLILVKGVCDVEDTNCLTEEGLLNWEHLHNYILVADVSDSVDYFTMAVKKLAPVFRHVEKKLSPLSPQQFCDQYMSHLQWTGSLQVYKDCHARLFHGAGEDVMLGMLLTTSVLERALGDVYLLRGGQCPSLLKDLLVTPELEAILGQTAIQILRVLIGPPISLNLRNVVWHGFPTPGEIPPRYLWFLLLLTASLGDLLRNHGVSCDQIPHRQPVEFPQLDRLRGDLPECSPADVGDMRSLFEASSLVSTKMSSVWTKAVQLYEGGSCGYSMVLLLPQLEYSLRQVFCLSNRCPDRLLTAQATTLFTTFDEIFDKYLPSGQENQLLKALEENYMDLLFDLLVYPDGLRIRDRLSHGEVDLFSIPEPVARALLVLMVGLTAKFVLPENLTILQIPSVQTAIQYCENYESKFHLISLVKHKCQEIFSLTAQLDDLIRYCPSLETRESSESWPFSEAGLKISSSLVTAVDHFYDKLDCPVSREDVYQELFDMFSNKRAVTLMNILIMKKIRTLYRFERECRDYEVTNLLLRMNSECLTAMSNVRHCLQHRQSQLESKELRSRQRDNLRRLIESCPHLYQAVHLVVIIVITSLYSMEEKTTPCNTPDPRKTLRFLKSVLQYCENIRTLTAPEKNKWVDAVELTQKFLTKVLDYTGGST